jgi:predicted component of type VI protein secretion system
VASFITTPVETIEEAAEDDAPAAAGGAPAGPRIGGRVDSREDVIKALEAISEYYRRREPTSPVLPLLQRAREWVNLDFMAILEDLAPGGLDEAKKVLAYRKGG